MSDLRSNSTDRMDVAYVANLARVSLTEKERALFQAQLDGILDYVRQLSELDVGGIEPTAHAVPVQNVLRTDEARPSLDREIAMNNAPDQKAGQFLVPRIIE